MTYDLNNEMDLIEKYLDGALSAQDEAYVEQLLNERDDLREVYNNMKMAVDAVYYTGLTRQVAAVAKEYSIKQTLSDNKKQTAPVRSIGYYALRAAAVVLITVASYTAIMYTTATPRHIYNDGFVSYELSVTRSNLQSTGIEYAYKNESWQEVLQIFSAAATPGREDIFLAGMASLQLNQASGAIRHFQKLIDMNAANGERSYTDESQFYMALAYVKLNDGANAYKLFQNIRNNPAHTYYHDAKKINMLKIKLMSWKK